MKAVIEGNALRLKWTRKTGRVAYCNLCEVANLSNWKVLTTAMVSYCEGKTDSSIVSWVARVKPTLCSVITKTKMSQLPNTSIEWQLLLKNWYGVTLTRKGSTLKTNVSSWNKCIKPFLEFMQFRDIIPLDIIIPSMKQVGEKISETSFRISIIGDPSPKAFYIDDNINKLIAPVSLSRSDIDYLDELQLELERRREKLKNCLVIYWEAIKSHYEYGQKVIASVKTSRILSRIKNEDFYDYLPNRKKGFRRKTHFAIPTNLDGFAIYLFLMDSINGMYNGTSTKLNNCFPSQNLNAYLSKDFDPFPPCEIENMSLIQSMDRMNWCMGVLSQRDVAYIVAVLMMLNPRFTYESLLDSNVYDKGGKSLLEFNDSGFSLSIEKARSKSIKKEQLDDLSYEIISTIMKMVENKRNLIDKQNQKRLFVTANRHGTKLIAPRQGRVSSWLTGYATKGTGYTDKCLMHFFPSLKKYGLIENTISHSKIRATEGVLEWFRTGSIRAASRKLGNSTKVALEHYLPKELVSTYSTRQVRRFQNLMIVAATINEDYLIEAVDFNTIEEVHRFIVDMIEINGKSKNPLISHLKDFSCNQKPKASSSGQLIASISEKALTALYLYKSAAINSDVDSKQLYLRDRSTKIAPMAIISLASYLKAVLPNNPDPGIRDSHKAALQKSGTLLTKTNWHKLVMTKKVLA